MLADSSGAFTVGGVSLGRGPLTLIAGPCALEAPAPCVGIARPASDLCRALALSFILQGSLVHSKRTRPGPARGLGPDRGTLAVGAPGDVTIFELEREWTFDVNETHSKSKNSPFHKHAFRGGPVAAIVGGKTVWQTEARTLQGA